MLFGMTQIAVRLPDELVEELDALVAAGSFGSRAAAVRAGIETLVAVERRRSVDATILDGYRRLPPSNADERAAIASLKDAIEEEPW
jgi:Arc/MetJ-type ribon-helix-helix transcriptional regulator